MAKTMSLMALDILMFFLRITNVPNFESFISCFNFKSSNNFEQWLG